MDRAADDIRLCRWGLKIKGVGGDMMTPFGDGYNNSLRLN